MMKFWLLTPTDADGGPGTTRHLTYLEPFSYTTSVSLNVPRLDNGTVITPVKLSLSALDIKACNYKGEGSSNGVWLNNRRYKEYKVVPDISFSTTSMCNIWYGDTSVMVFTILNIRFLSLVVRLHFNLRSIKYGTVLVGTVLIIRHLILWYPVALNRVMTILGR